MKRYLARQVIVVNIPEVLPSVRGDRFLLEQMVTQVLDNSVEVRGRRRADLDLCLVHRG